MARLAVGGHPHLVLQRGVHGVPLFCDDADRERFRAAMGEAARLHAVSIHAYVLQEGHVRVLLTPRAAIDLSRFVQALGRIYVAWYNQRHQRRGTLWNGRFRCCLLEAATWLLPAMRDIETEAVRAGQASAAQTWEWCSAAHHLGLRNDPLVSDHPAFWALGNTPFEREVAWREWLAREGGAEESRRIGDATERGWALGSPAFIAGLEEKAPRRLQPLPRGRPRKSAAP